MNTEKLTISEIAVHLPGAVGVFEKFGIDFYQKGRRTLEEACREHGADIKMLEHELEAAQAEARNHINFSEWSIERVIDHIRNTFHAAEKAVIPIIRKKIDQLAKDNDPSIIKIRNLFDQLVDELHPHSEEEENELFPYLLKMAEAKRHRLKSFTIKYLLHNPIQVLEIEHDKARAIIRQIREITGNYSAKPGAGREYGLLMSELEEFEKNFHRHIHIENNILFPKALELQAEVQEIVHSSVI